MKKCRIIVCYHKQDVMAKKEPYMPIHVGKAISNIQLGIQGDDEGINISYKNRSYCELTGMYWAWKNLKDVDVIGLCHYRRYFDFHNQCVSHMPHTAFHTNDFEKIDLSVPQYLTDKISDGNIILSRPRKYCYTLYTNYCMQHMSDDIRTVEKYIYENLDRKFQTAWYKVMQCGNNLSHYNMFIMTWHDFDVYCSWLFPLLQEMENRIDISHYTPVQGRIFGYIAERLLNVWVEANRIKTTFLPVIWFSDYEADKKVISNLRMILRNARANLAVKLATHHNMDKWLRNRSYTVKK